MAYDLLLLPRAEKDLDRVPKDTFRRLDEAIRALQETPRPFGIQKLEDELYRVRVGGWRVVFSILDRERRVVIYRILRRSEKTYKRLN